MKRSFLTIFALLTVFLSSISTTQAAETIKPKKELIHIVSLKFKAEYTQEQIDEALAQFIELKEKITTIKKFEWGLNVSKEEFDKGFTHCFTLTFKSQEGLENYIAHEDHLALIVVIQPMLEDIFIVDYWPGQ